MGICQKCGRPVKGYKYCLDCWNLATGKETPLKSILVEGDKRDR